VTFADLVWGIGLARGRPTNPARNTQQPKVNPSAAGYQAVAISFT
jgi:hypothetical protein